MMNNDRRAVFVAGVISRPDGVPGQLMDTLDDRFGRRHHSSEPYDFDFTDYYYKEHGQPLLRRWYVYESPFSPETIRERKQFAMRVEDDHRTDGDRPFNLDVGYVTGAKFVLASRKNYSNRIYLGDGVFAEVTLTFQNGEWERRPNTYPEFAGDREHDWLNEARKYWVSTKNNQ